MCKNIYFFFPPRSVAFVLRFAHLLTYLDLLYYIYNINKLKCIFFVVVDSMEACLLHGLKKIQNII